MGAAALPACQPDQVFGAGALVLHRAKRTSRNRLKTGLPGDLPGLLEGVSKGAPRRVIAAHAVHSPARRSRRGAKVNVARRGRVGIESEERARHELKEGVRAAADVAADVVLVV